MGNCMSSKTMAAEQPTLAPPHPQARRLWLVSTPLDSRDIPLDLVGIDSDGLRAALRNRGLETDHWALKIDPPCSSSSKLEASIFDIILQRGTLVPQLHPASSAYWKTITRRVAVGWTIWTDPEVLHATQQLVEARPKYDGRSNNSQQLARLLARHVEFVAPSTASQASGEEGEVGGAGSEMKENRSQMTLVSSQRSQSIEEDKVSSATMRSNHRMSSARPPLIHLSTAPAERGGAAEALVRPVLQRSAETEAGAATGSVRGKAQARFSQQYQSGSPLNPSRPTQHRVSASEVRARTSSDAAYAERRSSTLNGRVGGGGARRRSEAPAEWMVDPAQQFSSLRSRSIGRNAHRESVMSLGGGSMVASPTMWSAAGQGSPSMVGLPSLPSVSGTPMGGMPPMNPMAMPMFPQSGSIMFNPSLQIPYLPYAMPMLAPPSPGFHSKASSGVPTPPESPHVSTMHLPKHEFGYAFGQHHQQQQQQQHV